MSDAGERLIRSAKSPVSVPGNESVETGTSRDVLDAAKAAMSAIIDMHPMGHWTDDQVREVAIRAIMAERERISSMSVMRVKIDADEFRKLLDEGRAFADTDPEAQFIADAENSCPYCGGSGHKDDVTEGASHG